MRMGTANLCPAITPASPKSTLTLTPPILSWSNRPQPFNIEKIRNPNIFFSSPHRPDFRPYHNYLQLKEKVFVAIEGS